MMIVTSIHKNNDTLDVSTYWAISPLSILGKVFHTIILNKIAREVDLKSSKSNLDSNLVEE